MANNLKNKIDQVLDKLRPAIKSHGGGVELVSVKAGVVKLKIKGSCVGCPMATMTFGMGVGEELKKIKGVKKVVYA